jgi:hypothetical protein
MQLLHTYKESNRNKTLCQAITERIVIVTLSLIRPTACARGSFSLCSSTAYAHRQTEKMAVCRQNLTLGPLSSRSAFSLLVSALFKKFCLFLNTPSKAHLIATLI